MKLPDAEANAQLFPVVLMLIAKGDPTKVLGVPEIVKVVPATVAVIPVGKPLTFAPVAPPPKV